MGIDAGRSLRAQGDCDRHRCRCGRSICRLGGWFMRSARRRDFNWSPREDGHPPAYVPLNPTTAPGPLPLTYMRASAFPSDVLADGRILFEAGFPLGSGSTPELYLVYADGSGVESYRCDHGTARWGGKQLARATWSSRTELRWRGSLRRWRMRRTSLRRHCRVCGRDCGDGIGRMAGECAVRVRARITR